MPVLNAQPVLDRYSPSCTIENVYPVPNGGGWYVLAQNGNSAFVQVQYGPEFGSGSNWSEEQVLGSGAYGTIPVNAAGIRFRNAVAGKPQAVTVFLAPHNVPALGVQNLGTVNVVSGATLNFQHNEVAVASEPSASFDDAANVLNFTVVDDIPNTRVKVSVAFPATVLIPTTLEIAAADCSIGKSAANLFSTTAGFGINVPGSGNTAFASHVGAEAFNRFVMTADGLHAWGPGTGVTDVTIGRSGVGLLRVGAVTMNSTFGNGLVVGGDGTHASWSITDSGHEAFASVVPDGTTGYACFLVSVVGDTVDWRWYVDGAGIISWGPGNAARDVFLRRTAAGVLRVDNTLVVGSGASSANGVGTLTVQDRIFTGAVSTGGVWVDGGQFQFVGSRDANTLGFFNNGWWLAVDTVGNLTLQGTYGFRGGVGTGGSATAAATAVTLNKICGQVSFTGQANTGSVLKSFTVNCNQCLATDVVMVCMNNGTTAGGQFVVSAIPGAGAFTITVWTTTTNAGVTYSFNYWIMKVSTS